MHLSRFLPRFTMRRLMVAVAIVGIVLSIESMRRRSSECRLIADESVDTANALVGHCREVNRMIEWARSEGTADYKKWAQELETDNNATRKLEQFYRDLAAKYERAARYPWLPVAPDPPEPE
jgi:ribosomal protein L17